ncbi:hypothetical protein BCR26_02030 [Enterococcus rivorum]|uniref:Uncharacterized protein n=2 Tax=Enterococcus rivorum TaxID=762845 RepID=A0A1E5KZN7_9ENTE|nr:hypothetical protein BCR26_02030 [Enterococcus rivorum]
MNNVEKKEITATILEYDTVAPEVMQINNSKWAIMTYTVDGKVYISKNKIQVPMRASVNDTLTIKYNVKDPTQIYTKHLFVL